MRETRMEPHCGRLMRCYVDVSWCRGTVVDKRVEEGAHLVELEVRIENQLGDVAADGTSIVELPALLGA